MVVVTIIKLASSATCEGGSREAAICRSVLGLRWVKTVTSGEAVGGDLVPCWVNVEWSRVRGASVRFRAFELYLVVS